MNMLIKRIFFGKFLVIIAILYLLFFLNSPISYSLENRIIKISPGEAYDLIQQYQADSKLTIFDLRTLDRWQEERIEGAIHYPEKTSNQTVERIKYNEDQTYLIYSQSALDKEEALNIMEKTGINRIYLLEGGIKAWIEEELPTVFAKTIEPSAALELIKKNQKNPNFVIIDLRPLNQWERQRIENSINIDFSKEDFLDYLKESDKSNIYLIHCQKGVRGAKALPMMREQGFKYIYHLQGGLNNWIAKDMPIIEY